MVREFLHNKDLEDKYKSLQESNEGLTMILGYYSMRFGKITTEDIIKMVGLDEENLGLKK